MNSGLIPGLIAGPNRLSKAVLSHKQAIPGAEITQALANIGIARASLSAPVTRTSTTTPTNTGLENLNVSLLPSSRYRVTYRLYAEGNNGIQISLTHPSTFVRMDGEFRHYDFNNYSNSFIYADWYTNTGASGTVFYDSGSAPGSASIVIILDITTGSTANTYGTIGLLAAQSFSNATATSISQNTCVEVLKFA